MPGTTRGSAPVPAVPTVPAVPRVSARSLAPTIDTTAASHGAGPGAEDRDAPVQGTDTTPPRPHAGGFIRRNALSLSCFGLFFAFLLGQTLTGWHVYNEDATAHQQEVVSLGRYLATGHFVEATFENWESEFLQMFGFILLTAWLVQRGSGESKRPHGDPSDEDPRHHRNDPDAPWPVRRGGAWLKLYENSLLLAFILLFVMSIVGHALGGLAAYNEDQAGHGQEAATLTEFVSSSDFWFQSFQNWQSEFLAVGTVVTLSIFLRQKGSPQSKPVHSPTWQTGV